jgi:hypothetical protein
MLALLAVVLLALSACQTQGELPACESHCTVVVVGATQERGGQTTDTTATVPLVP